MNKKIIVIVIFVLIVVFLSFIFFFITDNNHMENTQDQNLEQTNLEISDSNHEDEIQDLTNYILESTRFKIGIIYKIENNIIYFKTKDNEYYLFEDRAEFRYLDGRTLENLQFSDIKEGYYIETSPDRKIHIFTNITGEKLKNALIKRMSLPYDEDNYTIVGFDIENIEKTINNEAIVTIKIYDLIDSYNSSNEQPVSFEIKVKFTNETKYHSKGGNIYNVDTLTQALGNINSMRLNPNTINNQYPEVLEFSSTDT